MMHPGLKTTSLRQHLTLNFPMEERFVFPGAAPMSECYKPFCFGLEHLTSSTAGLRGSLSSTHPLLGWLFFCWVLKLPKQSSLQCQKTSSKVQSCTHTQSTAYRNEEILQSPHSTRIQGQFSAEAQQRYLR